MSTISFSGLASGIDTASVVDSLIEVERAPITLLEEKQEYFAAKLESYTEFNTLIESLNVSVISLNSKNDLASFEVANNGSESFSISTTSITEPGTYSVEVVSLAECQKDLCPDGFADSDTTLLTGELKIGDATLSYAGVSLSELAELVSEGEYGVSGSIINNGTEDGYHLLIAADTAGEEIDIVGTGDIVINTDSDGHTVASSQAHAIIDGIDFYSSSNTITSAIPGSRITLMDVSDSGFDKMTISSDSESVITAALENVVTAYNKMNEYVDSVSASDSTLANTMRTVLRGVKSYLTGSTLVNLGISSDYETGELSFDSEVFSEAYADDPDRVVADLLGGDDNDGIMIRLDDYVADLLSGTSGFLATKESSINDTIADLDDTIDRMEARLEKRQETLEAQFTAMETLISSLNSQADYLESFFSSDSSS